MPLEPEKYLGKIVEVRFVDHVSSGEAEQELIICTVRGRLVHDDWQKIRVRTWETDEDTDESANVEYVTLVRAAVVSIRSLTYEEN